MSCGIEAVISKNKYLSANQIRKGDFTMEFIQFKNMPTELEMQHNKNKLEKYKKCKNNAELCDLLSIFLLSILLIINIYLANNMHTAFGVPAGLILGYLVFRLFIDNDILKHEFKDNLIDNIVKYQIGMDMKKVENLKKLIYFYDFFNDCIIFIQNNKITYIYAEMTDCVTLYVHMKGISPTGRYCEFGAKLSELTAEKCIKQVSKDNVYLFDFSDYSLIIPCDEDGNIQPIIYQHTDGNKKRKEDKNHFQKLTEGEKEMICDICCHNQSNHSQEELDILCEKCFLS